MIEEFDGSFLIRAISYSKGMRDHIFESDVTTVNIYLVGPFIWHRLPS